MDASAFEYIKPTDDELKTMAVLRQAAADYANVLDNELHNGPDKTYILRSLRTVAMWVNVCVTREADGSPRDIQQLLED